MTPGKAKVNVNFGTESKLQGHHHNSDQAARRHHMMCSICGRQFATPLFGARGDRGELIR